MRDAMWGFPKRKPQLFAESAAALSSAVAFYAFGRRLARWQQRLLAAWVAMPGGRCLVAERVDFEPPCGWTVWGRLRERLTVAGTSTDQWVFFRSQWRSRRFGVFPLTRARRAAAFWQAQTDSAVTFHPARSSGQFRVPGIRATVDAGGWVARAFEPLPPFHRAYRGDARRLLEISAGISSLLQGMMERTPSSPAHWAPIHGDLTPSNLREDASGVVWLIDWEDATWAPPLADVLRFTLAEETMRGAQDAAAVARRVKDGLPVPARDLAEAAAFWLGHHNFRCGPGERSEVSRGKAVDLARILTARRALERLARSAG